MAILNSDIKLMASERLTDETDGGGRMTGNEVVDGQVNNLFPDIARLDRVYGRVNLRKAFLHIDTANVDRYYGAHTIIEDAPDDPNVSTVLFGTESHTDERADARDRIESYVTQGPLAQMRLLGTQLAGQRTITVYQRTEEPLPEIGESLVLSVESSGDPANGQQQYVRVRDVNHETRTFSETISGDFTEFTRRVVSVGLTTALREDFPGGSATKLNDDSHTKIRSTQVSSAAKYQGIQPLAELADNGDTVIKVSSIYAPLVPATQGENPVTDVQAGGSTALTLSSGGVDFEVPQVNSTLEIAITLSNRGFSYVPNLQPLPAPGSVVVEYRTLGKWYRAVDDGVGNITGDAAGSVDYQTGSVSVTLQALPDVGTPVLVFWGTGVHYTDRAGGTMVVDDLGMTVELDHPYIRPGSVSVSWLVGGATKTATDTAAEGVLAGDATGRVFYGHTLGAVTTNGKLYIEFSTLPDPNTQISVDYDTGGDVSASATPTKDGSGYVSITAANSPIKAGSVVLQWTVTRSYDGVEYRGHNFTSSHLHKQKASETTITYTAADDGSGVFPGVADATVNYTTGVIKFKPERVHTYDKWGDDRTWTEVTETDTWADGGTIAYSYQKDSVTPANHNVSANLQPIAMDLTPLLQDAIVAETLKFRWQGHTFVDRPGGALYRDPDSAGAGTFAGNVDYSTGVATISDWGTPNGTNTVNLDTMLSTFGDWWITEATFRTPGSPLRAGGFNLQAGTFDGADLLTASGDLSGLITGTKVEGTVNYDTGVVTVKFGETVADSGLTTEQKQEWWYNANDVDGSGNIWKPERVLPNTLRFNAVVLSNLPLDADLLGLDPVRLPPDGKVPIYQEAGVVVVHNTQSDTMPNGLSAAQVVTLSRDTLALVYLRDANDAAVSSDLYTVDLATGKITMASPLDLSGYTEPLEAYHRVEDMLLVSDVQIDGSLTVIGGVSRDYPKDTTFVSSALIFGDLQARVNHFFTQDTWNGSSWSDSQSGSGTTAQYNSVTYPVAVENQGAIKERWALKFTSSTAFDIIGETVGIIGTGNISTDVMPANPNTSTPYFQLQKEGFGSGWKAGNLIRFNTEAAAAPMWIARTILSGQATAENDSFRIQNRGDAD